MGELSARVKAEAKATGIVFMKVFSFESFRIVRPLFVLCVGQIFTCTNAHDSSSWAWNRLFIGKFFANTDASEA